MIYQTDMDWCYLLNTIQLLLVIIFVSLFGYSPKNIKNVHVFLLFIYDCYHRFLFSHLQMQFFLFFASSSALFFIVAFDLLKDVKKIQFFFSFVHFAFRDKSSIVMMSFRISFCFFYLKKMIFFRLIACIIAIVSVNVIVMSEEMNLIHSFFHPIVLSIKYRIRKKNISFNLTYADHPIGVASKWFMNEKNKRFSFYFSIFSRMHYYY